MISLSILAESDDRWSLVGHMRSSTLVYPGGLYGEIRKEVEIFRQS